MRGVILYGMIDESEMHIYMTNKAMKHLEKSGEILFVGLELYFTYLMRKKVVFFIEKPDREVTKITDNLFIYFRPIQTRNLKVKDIKGDESDLMDLPVTRKGALVPRYVKISRKKGKWRGDFTWKTGNFYMKPLLLNYN